MNTFKEILDTFLAVFLVEGLPDVLNTFSENGRESHAHSGLWIS